MARMSMTTFKERLGVINTFIWEYFKVGIVVPVDHYDCPHCTKTTERKNLYISMIRLEAPYTVAILGCGYCGGIGFVNLMDKTLYSTLKTYDPELLKIFFFNDEFEQTKYAKLAAYGLNEIYSIVPLWDYLDPKNNITKQLLPFKA